MRWLGYKGVSVQENIGGTVSFTEVYLVDSVTSLHIPMSLAIIYLLAHFIAKKCRFEHTAPQNGSLGTCDGIDEIEYGGAGCMFGCSEGYELEKGYRDVQFECSASAEIVPVPKNIQCVGTSYLSML